MKNSLDETQEKQLQDIEQFNRTLGANGWDLSNKIIEGKNIRGIHLTKSTWEDVNLTSLEADSSRFGNVHFIKVNFMGVNMSDSVFMNCTFKECDFENSKFIKAVFIQCHFLKSNFNNVDLSRSSIQASDFNEAKTKDTNWKYAKFMNVLFSKSEYENVAFTNSQLSNVTFSASKLTKSGFSNSDIKQCDFQINGDTVSFADAKIDHLSIKGLRSINNLKLAGIKGKSLILEDLDNSEFLVLSFAEISDFQLRNSNLKLTSCVSASFYSAIIQNTSFNFVQFDNSKFYSTRFDNITFNDEVYFDGANLEGVSFTNIKKSADYLGSFKNTKFEGKEPF